MALSEISPWRYDVFLSFRGEDTRNSFTGHLYEALVQAGINAFRDTEELSRGKEISKELCEAIDGSRFFLVVFSKNYASSTWCLDELVRIMGCMEQHPSGQMVWPVFYDVDPSTVRKQNSVFGEAFDRHEERFKTELEKVERWRQALTKAANLSGRHLDNGSESTFIKEIVEEISAKLNRTLLTVAKNPVGIDSHIQQLEKALNIGCNDIRMIGIYGLGGIGKTTLAKAIYNLIVHHFEGCSFLPNIKEKCNTSMHDGLVQLQESLLRDILLDKMHWSINFVDRGTSILRERLRMKKVLIVLDDVDNISHLQKLAGNADWFGPGSRVIITTRNKQLLSGIDWIYRVDRLNDANSLELFCWNAFKKPRPVAEFEQLSNVAVRYAAGHPLALIVVGASLCGCDEEDVWRSQLKKLEMIPNRDVHEILKLSFDGLEDHEKEIFLDIACFFRGTNVKTQPVMSFWDSCGFFAKVGVDVLVKKCLISIESNELRMHDLIQLMGREIVRQEAPNDPEERSRLWFHEDILQVLNENEGTKKVQGIFLDMPKAANEVSLHPKSFSRMKKLRLLIIRDVNVIGTPEYLSNELRWFECRGSLSYIVPSNFHPKKLVVLDISHYPVKQLGAKGFENIRSLILEDCEMMTEIGDISLMPNLVRLEVINCINLESFSNGGLKSKALEFLSLKSCCKLKKFPDILEEMGRLYSLRLEGTGVTELPTSVEKLTGLHGLTLDLCKDLVHLPSSIYMLKNLDGLQLSNCFKLDKIQPPSNSIEHIQDFIPIYLWSMDFKYSSLLELDFIMAFNCFNSLNHLYLSGSKIRRLPSGMSKFKVLRSIELINCKHLEHIPADLPPIIQHLEATGCDSLSKLDVTILFDVDVLSINGYLCQDYWKEVFLYQGICRDKYVELRLPGNEIPNSFECCSSSTVDSLLLQLPLHEKKHVVGIILGVVYNMKNSHGFFEVQINGVNVEYITPTPLSGELDHLHISYLPRDLGHLDRVLSGDTSHCDVTLVQLKDSHFGDEPGGSWVKKFGCRLVFDDALSDFSSRSSKRKRM